MADRQSWHTVITSDANEEAADVDVLNVSKVADVRFSPL